MDEKPRRHPGPVSRTGVLVALTLLAWGGLLPAAFADDVIAPTYPPAPGATSCCYTPAPTTAPTNPAYTTPRATRPPTRPPRSQAPSRSGVPTAPGAGGRAVLVLEPRSGRPGTSVTVTGSAFVACAPENRVDFLWDGAGIDPFRVAVAANGGFHTRLTVPRSAAKGSHSLRVQCGQKAYAAAAFEVTAESSTAASAPGVVGTGGGGTGLLIGGLGAAGLLAAALVAYLGFFRLRRGPRWARTHVHAVMRPGFAPDGVQDVDDPPGRSRTVRLEPRPDPGDHTIEEKDR
ncbi:hypothetical protein GCM10023205_17820 [Yinghuangia aomiensis]|uniref:IPT/TIG domain-containing protein n=1 Tax=Yinghuangia aomiensis TaxID=676205 RepID=A0ABP9H597_9ACTN